jgi:DNA-binding GntR family transcriptional regulator
MADPVYAALSKALLSGKLRPGTPLRERTLAELFGVTRGAVRRALLQLVEEGKLEAFANRGAYVPQPSGEAIREVYEARKAVESGLVALIAPRITPTELARLKSHVAKERQAERRGDREASVRLSGAFHGELVALAGNETLSEIVTRLVGRTQLYVSLFESARHSGCAPDEHGAIVSALTKKDASGAAAAMVRHLELVHARVQEHVGDKQSDDIADALRAFVP